ESCNQPDDCAERAFDPHRPTLSISTGQGLLLVAFATHTYAVGTVPPSITYSVPVMVPARSEARKAIRLATSSGLDGRPIGIPPSESMIIRLPRSMSPPCSEPNRLASSTAASVSIQPGDTRTTRTPLGDTCLERALL